MEQKDMIHSAFLSWDFPLAWFLQKFKDAFSWSGATERIWLFAILEIQEVRVYQ